MTSDPLNQIELISTLSVPRYAPRLKPTPIPGARWNEEPLYCLQINDEWVSHLLGVMTALDQPDTWVGTKEEIYDARQQVNEIMVAFMEQCDPMNNCCPEPNRTRYDEDGNYEISYDGGETWESGNDSDPRYTSPQYPPLAGDDGSVKRCQAANSVISEIELKVAAWEDLLELGTSFIEFGLAAIAALAVGIFAPAAVPFIFGACLAILKALWSSSVEDYGDAFSDPVYDDLLCIVFCHASDDGTFTETAIDQIIVDISTTFSGNTIARDAFTIAFRGWRAVGTSNAAVINNGSRSCDGCDCDEEHVRMYSVWNAGSFDPDTSWLTIDAEFVGGSYQAWARFVDGGDDYDVCGFATMEILSGSINTSSIWLCHSSSPIPLGLTNIQDTCFAVVAYSNDAPFTIRIQGGLDYCS